MSFTFTITICLGISLQASPPVLYVINITRFPVALPTPPLGAIQDSVLFIDVKAQVFDLVNPSSIVLLTLPTSGLLLDSSAHLLSVGSRIDLNYAGTNVNGSNSTHVGFLYYLPTVHATNPLCGVEFTDSFTYTLVQDNLYALENQTVTVDRLLCSYCPSPYWLSGSVCHPCPTGTTLQLPASGRLFRIQLTILNVVQ